MPDKITTKQDLRDWVSSLSFTYREYDYVDNVTNEGDLLDKIAFVELKEQFSEGGCPPLELLPNLSRVRVSGRGSREIAQTLSKLPKLSELELLGWDFEAIAWPELGGLALKRLVISFWEDGAVPPMIFELASLEELALRSDSVLHVPDRFAELKGLKSLEIRAAKVDAVPDSIHECKDLVTLDLHFPVAVSRMLRGMQKLENLGIDALLEHVDEAADLETVRQLPPLRHLYLYSTSSMRLWSAYRKWHQIQLLILENGDVDEFQVEGNVLSTMSALTIRNCEIQHWPEWMRGLQNLLQLTVEYNFGLGKPPEWVTALPKLRWLNLYGNGFANEDGYMM